MVDEAVSMIRALALLFALLTSQALAQPVCPQTPAAGTSNTNCANTAFVQKAATAAIVAAASTYPISNSGGQIIFVGPTHSGRLTRSSSTALSFAPFVGDLIKINGVLYQIPSAGISGLGNTSVFVNGVAAQNLGASTLYWVYAFNNSGTITADFSTTGHATSSTAGNVGTEIKSSDDTRSLIGMIFTDGSNHFNDSDTQRNVASWFNRVTRSGQNRFTANRTTTSTTFAELNTEIRIEFVIWPDEFAFYGSNGPVFVSGSYGAVTSVGFDGTTNEHTAVEMFGDPAPGVIAPSSISLAKSGLSEGHHYVTVLGRITSGVSAGTWGDTADGAELLYQQSIWVK